ncbi:MAG: tetratricopeptide repeat protein [Anaerolineae bacterium]|nr:tetratricopeptide repeat protein [Anaerolineae bacterium]
MSNVFTIGRAGTTEADIQVGDAWSKHFNGQNEAALEQFRKLVEKFANHIDANFGLALCLKTAGQKSEASAAFAKVKELCQAELDKKIEEPDRYQMLIRICTQHMSTLRN